MKKNIINILKEIHYCLPAGIRATYMYVINQVRGLKYFILPVHKYKGKEKNSGEVLSIIYLGWDHRIAAYWTHKFMVDHYSEQENKKIPIWKVSEYLDAIKKSFDFAIVEMNLLTRRFAGINSGFLLPRWFEMQIIPKELVNSNRNSDIKRRIRKFSLTFKKGIPEDGLKFFFERMFIPYICNRHGESAVHTTYKYLLSLYKKKGSQLDFILKDNMPVAGSFTEFIGKKFRMTAMGILDGREDILKSGVTGAIYYYEMLDCIEKGIESVNIGGTSPILTDGLTRFKLALGAKAADSNFHGDLMLWFRPLCNSAAVKTILKDNPFIFKIKKDLFRAIYIDPSEIENKVMFEKLIKHTHCENINGTIIYCFGNTETIIEWVKELDYHNTRVLNYQINN